MSTASSTIEGGGAFSHSARRDTHRPRWAQDLERSLDALNDRIYRLTGRRRRDAHDVERGYVGQGESPFDASEAEQRRLQRSSESGPGYRGERESGPFYDPNLEDGRISHSTSGQRRDRMDAIMRRQDSQIAELRGLVRRVTRQPTVGERNQLAAAYHRADSVYARLGRTTPEPMGGESPMLYRHRLADGLKDVSPTLSRSHMDALRDDAFKVAEARIYQDALDEAKRGGGAPMVLRSHTYQDATGHNVTEHYGDPLAWMAPFMGPGACLKIRRPDELQ